MPHRETRTCPGTRVCCPACGGVVLNESFRNGDHFRMCARKIGQGSHRRGCGQHFYVYCTARLCTVLAVTRAERERFEADQSTPEEILAALGQRLAEAA